MESKLSTLATGTTIVLSLLLVVGLILTGLFISGGFGLALMMVLMFLLLVIIGMKSVGRPLGVLINERKVMSLSRFQITIWTLFILSAFLFVSLQRIHDPTVQDPLSITVDWHLWALLGISTGSFVGSSLVASTKKKKEPAKPAAAKEVAERFKGMGETEESVNENREGILYGNATVEDARFLDLLEGDELKNTAYVDLSKIQMLLFTLVAAIAYAAALFRWVGENAPSDLVSFPELSEGLVTILGISHAGYLGNKAIDHTRVK